MQQIKPSPQFEPFALLFFAQIFCVKLFLHELQLNVENRFERKHCFDRLLLCVCRYTCTALVKIFVSAD